MAWHHLSRPEREVVEEPNAASRQIGPWPVNSFRMATDSDSKAGLEPYDKELDWFRSTLYVLSQGLKVMTSK